MFAISLAETPRARLMILRTDADDGDGRRGDGRPSSKMVHRGLRVRVLARCAQLIILSDQLKSGHSFAIRLLNIIAIAETEIKRRVHCTVCTC